MRTKTRLEPGRVAWFAVVTVLTLAIGWLALRAAVVRALPETSAPLLAIAPRDGSTTLDRVTAEIVSAKAPPPAAVYTPAAAAAAEVPLDDRPFLLFAIRALAAGREADGVRLLEEARRRDPRQRYTRLLLLDRYLRGNRVGDAVAEMTVLNRLLPATREVLANALAGFAMDPATSQPTRRALADDPQLLNDVLVTLATRTDPTAVLRFAGPRAPAGLQPAGWRTALIDAMVTRGNFSAARRFWARAYGIDIGKTGAIHDAALRGTRSGPPFNWTLAANEVGAAEIGGGALRIDYYGRRSGPLASQLIVLSPGRYRFSYAVSGSGGDSNGGLVWTLTCQGQPATVVMTSPTAPLRPTARLVAIDFAVPVGCVAQRLSLDGLGGGFAGSTNARITRLALEPLP